MNTKKKVCWAVVKELSPWKGDTWLGEAYREDTGERSATELTVRNWCSGIFVAQSAEYTCAHARTTVWTNSLDAGHDLSDVGRLAVVLHAWRFTCHCHRADWDVLFGQPATREAQAAARVWAVGFGHSQGQIAARWELRDPIAPDWRIRVSEAGEAAA